MGRGWVAVGLILAATLLPGSAFAASIKPVTNGHQGCTTPEASVDGVASTSADCLTTATQGAMQNFTIPSAFGWSFVDSVTLDIAKVGNATFHVEFFGDAAAVWSVPFLPGGSVKVMNPGGKPVYGFEVVVDYDPVPAVGVGFKLYEVTVSGTDATGPTDPGTPAPAPGPPVLRIAPKYVTWDGLDVWVVEGEATQVFYSFPGSAEVLVCSNVLVGDTSCNISDAQHANQRIHVRAVTTDSAGTVIAETWFEVDLAHHVELGRYSFQLLEQILQQLKDLNARLERLFLFDPAGPGYQAINNTYNTINNYGPWGEAAKGVEKIGQLVDQAKLGDHPAVDQLEGDYFTFPLHIQGSVFLFRMPLMEVLAIEGWDILWKLINACLWGGFLIWLVTRLAPKPSV